MAKRRRKNGKRNRERRSRRPVVEATWAWADRVEVEAKLTARGEVRFRVLDAPRVPRLGREHAAHWLRQTLCPWLPHEVCYQMLWGRWPP